MVAARQRQHSQQGRDHNSKSHTTPPTPWDSAENSFVTRWCAASWLWLACSMDCLTKAALPDNQNLKPGKLEIGNKLSEPCIRIR